jgi:hypothetical protein
MIRRPALLIYLFFRFISCLGVALLGGLAIWILFFSSS